MQPFSKDLKDHWQLFEAEAIAMQKRGLLEITRDQQICAISIFSDRQAA